MRVGNHTVGYWDISEPMGTTLGIAQSFKVDKLKKQDAA